VRTLTAKRGCLTCGGAGASVPLEDATMDDYCDCVTDQLQGKHEWVALADGLIVVEAS
jgi:hypothetical protein